MGNHKRALIFGVSGQDGAYLAKFLLDKNYIVFGTSRDAELSSWNNLKRLGIHDQVNCLSAAINDFRSTLTAITIAEPHEIYNLAGQSSVGLSFQQPAEAHESINLATLNLLEVLRFINHPIRFYNASSSECFGDTGCVPADEYTPFRPRSPYAVAKASAFWQVNNYREAYGLYACSGILFNHESPLRPERFVTRKIVSSACRIAAGSNEKLRIGNIEIVRDWGWAPEYVDAMWRMLQQDEPEDYVIATGKSNLLREFIETVFSSFDLDWHDHIEIDRFLFRPTDIAMSLANPEKAKIKLNWSAQRFLPDIAACMIDSEKIAT